MGRFGCVPMDEAHLAAALRYVNYGDTITNYGDSALN